MQIVKILVEATLQAVLFLAAYVALLYIHFSLQ